jgi:hypothetical protein
MRSTEREGLEERTESRKQRGKQQGRQPGRERTEQGESFSGQSVREEGQSSRQTDEQTRTGSSDLPE